MCSTDSDCSTALELTAKGNETYFTRIEVSNGVGQSNVTSNSIGELKRVCVRI